MCGRHGGVWDTGAWGRGAGPSCRICWVSFHLSPVGAGERGAGPGSAPHRGAGEAAWCPARAGPASAPPPALQPHPWTTRGGQVLPPPQGHGGSGVMSGHNLVNKSSMREAAGTPSLGSWWPGPALRARPGTYGLQGPCWTCWEFLGK